MLRQLGNLFEKRSTPPRPAADLPAPEPERIHLGVWPRRRQQKVVSFSPQFYASGMIQPPPIPKSLRRF